MAETVERDVFLDASSFNPYLDRSIDVRRVLQAFEYESFRFLRFSTDEIGLLLYRHILNTSCLLLSEVDAVVVSFLR